MSDYASGGRGGPTAADIAAAQAMSGEDRAAFIRSMVERLASRLESQPEDLDGNQTVDVLDLLILIAAWGPCS